MRHPVAVSDQNVQPGPHLRLGRRWWRLGWVVLIVLILWTIGGSIIEAQVQRAVADAPWPEQLLADVAAVRAEDFDLEEAGGRGNRNIDDSLDLVAIAVRP